MYRINTELRLIQGFTKDGKDQILFPKEKMLTDSYDQYEIREMCFACGVSKQRLLQQMNRASAEAAQEAAEEEGTWPSEQYIMDSMNILIQSPLYFARPQYEFAYETQQERDPEKQSGTLKTLVSCGLLSLDEGRDKLGYDAWEGVPLSNQPVVITAQGAIAFGQAAPPKALPSGEGPEARTEGGGSQSGEIVPSGKKRGKLALSRPVIDVEFIEESNRQQITHFAALAREDRRFDKSHPGMMIDPHHHSLQGERARKNIQDKVKKHLEKVAKKIAGKVRAHKVAKVDEEDIKKLLGDEEFWTQLWIDLPPEILEDLADAMRAGMSTGMLGAGVNVSHADLINEFNEIAREYAARRAAEMVGMKYDKNGDLVANPKAQYVISDTTRDELRTLITRAFEQNTDMADLAAEIEDAGAFSPVRAQMIAKTEGARPGWRHIFSAEKTGVVTTVR